MKELDQWDQFRGVQDSNSLINIRASARQLSREDIDTSVSMEVVLEEFIASIRWGNDYIGPQFRGRERPRPLGRDGLFAEEN